ncbi:MAG: BatD family protein [Gemmatimonadaceae bacterium]
MSGLLVVLAQLTITASAPQTAGACEPIVLTVEARARGTASPRISIPDLHPFTLARSSATPHVTTDRQGRQWSLDEYRYTISTPSTGSFVIPPFEARRGGAVARSAPIRIDVGARPGGDSTPAIMASAAGDDGEGITFRAITVPDTVYVGEQTTYQAAAFVDDSIRSRMRRNPEFFPPEMRAMLVYELPFVRGFVAGARGECQEVPVFQRGLFPLTSGTHVIPPARLAFSLPRLFSFFSKEESRELFTDTLQLVAVEAPLQGRPSGYSGAVGDMRISARVDSTARVGDPTVLTVTVSGSGNVKLFPRPEIAIPRASAIQGEERVEIDSGTTVRGSKEFDWIVTPKLAGRLDIPPITYAFFNPATERYEMAATSALTLRVLPGGLAASETETRPQTFLPLRREFRGPVGVPLHDRPGFWLLLVVAPLPALTLGARRKYRPGIRKRSALADLRDSARAGQRAHPLRIRRSFLGALANRLRLTPDALVRRGSFARMLRRAGVSPDVAMAAEILLAELDSAAFSAAAPSVARAAERAVAVYEAVDREARVRGAIDLKHVGLVVMLGCVASAAGLHAFPPSQRAAQRLFDEGVAAYDARQFSVAEHAFGTLARDIPRAPDAWANLGTSAWSAGDTATSIIGWQRALRLEPLARDARARLALAGSDTRRGAGAVPPLPTAALAIATALLWVTACTAALVRVARSRPNAGSLTVALARTAAVGALVMGVGAIRVERQLTDPGLTVVTDHSELRSIPALGAERVSVVEEGKVVRVVERRGEWALISIDAVREGWIEEQRLAPITGG